MPWPRSSAGGAAAFGVELVAGRRDVEFAGLPGRVRGYRVGAGLRSVHDGGAQ